MSGNKCGHNKLSPRYPKRTGKNTFFVIKNACAAVRKWYDNPKNFLQNLRFIREKDSQRRSESREAIADFLIASLNNMDLLDKRVVQFTREKGKVDITLSQLANKSDLFYKRAQRAFKCLREAGYIEVEYKSVFNKEKGAWEHHAAVKKFTTKFFLHLGIKKQRLEEAINYIYKKVKPFVSDANKFDIAKAREKCMETVANLKKKFGDYNKNQRRVGLSYSNSMN